MQQLNKISILETVALVRDSAYVNKRVCGWANSTCFSATLF